MKKCIAYSAIAGSPTEWLPCVRLTLAGRKLCRRHSDLVAGVMLGVFAAGLAEERAENLKPRYRKHGKGRWPALLDMRFRASREFAKLDRFLR